MSLMLSSDRAGDKTLPGGAALCSSPRMILAPSALPTVAALLLPGLDRSSGAATRDSMNLDCASFEPWEIMDVFIEVSWDEELLSPLLLFLKRPL